MDAFSIATAAYIVASLLFILALAGLSKQESAKNGLTYGIVGMAVALLASVAVVIDETKNDHQIAIVLMLGAIAIGAAIGLWRAKIVEMTGMPELIAALHSFVGLAAVLIGINGHIEGSSDSLSSLINIHQAEVAIGIFIGAVTFTGSIVANLKLSGKMKSEPVACRLRDPDRHLRRRRPARNVPEHHHRAADRPRSGSRLPPSRVHRRRRHAGRGLDA
jgi:NAD(P) transhydrogenase subunit beta